MASTEGLVPITRAFLASYYDKYPLNPPLSEDVARLSSEIRSSIAQLQTVSPLTSDEALVVKDIDIQPPHKIDENMWKNREQIEELLYLLDTSNLPSTLQQESTPEDAELVLLLKQLKDKVEESLKVLQYFQAKNADFVFNTVMTYMPQDFRGTLIRQQKERSERNKQAEVDALIKSGGTIRDKYALLWKQQMERRRQLAQLGSATGVYKTLVKYLVGVPQVLLDFIQQINDDEGPMEEQRQRYGPPLYSLTVMSLYIRVFLYLAWGRFEAKTLDKDQVALLEQSVNVYTSEFERFIKFMGEVFANSPFFITASEVTELRGDDDYKEMNIPAGKNYEVVLNVESVNSYIAWDFSLEQSKLSMYGLGEGKKRVREIRGHLERVMVQSCLVRGISLSVWSLGHEAKLLAASNGEVDVEGKMDKGFRDIGFSMEYSNGSGEKTLILPYRRCVSDQGNFCTCMAGNYKLIWDNSFSTFFKKALRFKVDCIPPVAEPEPLQQ